MSLASIAADLLDGRDSVVVAAAMSPQLPVCTIRALLAEARTRGISVTLLVADIPGRFDFLDARDEVDLRAGRLKVVALAGSIPSRLAEWVDALPMSLWNTDRALRRGDVPCDIYAVRAQEAPGGGLDLGNAVGFTPGMLGRPDVGILVELSPGGEYARELYVVDPDLAKRARVWRDPERYRLAKSTVETAISPIVEQIGHNVAALIPAEATVQIGIGGFANSVLRSLIGKPRIGFHTGTLPTALRGLLAGGAFTGQAKRVDAGVHVATGLAVDAGPASWADSLSLRPIAQTHDPAVLARHDRLWAVNSAFSVDLFGQVNAEWLGGLRRASGGGQVDFMHAAHASRDGAAVLALPSRTSRGTSRILGVLESPGVVTTTGAEVDFVVTEFGSAHLTAVTMEEKKARLIAIAHPDDRRSLAGA